MAGVEGKDSRRDCRSSVRRKALKGKAQECWKLKKCFPGFKGWELVGRVAKPEYEPSFYQGKGRKTPREWRKEGFLNLADAEGCESISKGAMEGNGKLLEVAAKREKLVKVD
jgi:hypothetical protein